MPTATEKEREVDLKKPCGPPISSPVGNVYFDTQVFDGVALSDWNRVVGAAVAGRFNYRVSINTLYELFHGLASGSADHFTDNKARLLKALQVPGSEVLPFTGEFLRQTLGLAPRPDLGHYMVELLVPVLDNAFQPEDLVSASQNIQAQIEYGKSIWIRELSTAVSEGKPIPPRDVFARYIALENGILPSPENLEQIAKRLDAAYCHMASIAKAVMNTGSRYKHEEKASDWLDNQQLYYLSDPSFTFVTLERKLITKIGGSSQAGHVVRFPDFLSTLTADESLDKR